MKMVCIDFKEQYNDVDLTIGNYVYTSQYNRAVIYGVKQVNYINNNIIITYTVEPNKKTTVNVSFEMNTIKTMTIN